MRFLSGLTLLALACPVPCPGQDAAANSRTVPAKPTLDELVLFMPLKYPHGDWTPRNLQFQDVDFRADDGMKLHGWYCPVADPRGVILVAHGNAGNVATRVGWLRCLQTHLRVTVFAFDYRGFGRSEGTPTVEGVLLDAKAARARLCELAKIRDSEMLLMGESLGGAIAVHLAASSPPRGLILQSTFSSFREVADVYSPRLSWLVPRNKLNSLDLISRYRGPLLQSHGTADQVIPFASGQKLFQAAHEPKQFLAIPNADHNDWLTEDYLRKLEEFIASVSPTRQ